MRYLIETPASYDDLAPGARARLLKAAAVKLAVDGPLRFEASRLEGDRWQHVLTTDVPDPDAWAVRQALDLSVGPTAGARVAAIAQRTGQSLVAFQPWDHVAVLAPAPRLDVRVRDVLAAALRVDPWSLHVWLDHDADGHITRVVIARAPDTVTRVRSGDILIETMRGLHLDIPDHAQWRLTPAPGRELALDAFVDPLREILLADPNVTGSMVVTVGRAESGEMLHLDLATKATHVAIQGQTRSGKSVFAYQMLSTLAAHPAVVIAGADPSGLLLGPFAGTRHAEHQALGTNDPERVLAVLTRLVGEMDRRTASLLAEMTDKIEGFTPERPLYVVVLEEYAGLRRAIQAADSDGRPPAAKVLPQVDLMISRLLAEGAKVGFRVLLMAQRLDTTVLAGGDRSNVPTRITFRVDKPEAVTMLHESLPPGLDVEDVRNMPAGVGLYETAVAGQRVTRFRGPFLEGDYRAYVERIRGANPPIDGGEHEDIVEIGELAFTLDDLDEFSLEDLTA